MSRRSRKSNINLLIEASYKYYDKNYKPDGCQFTCPMIGKLVKITPQNDPSQTTAQRISQQLRLYTGGRTTYGRAGDPIVQNYLGRTQGQAGGAGAPLRNVFG